MILHLRLEFVDPLVSLEPFTWAGVVLANATTECIARGLRCEEMGPNMCSGVHSSSLVFVRTSTLTGIIHAPFRDPYCYC